MKRLFLIVSPYLFFCLLFSLIFILRTPKNKNKEEKIVSDSTQVIIDSLLIINDSLENHLQNQDSQIEEIVESHDLNLSQDGKFKLIVGSFQLQKKADAIYDELKIKGYNPFFVDGPYDWIRVCAGTGNTSDDLAPIMISLRQDGYEPWILENE